MRICSTIFLLALLTVTLSGCFDLKNETEVTTVPKTESEKPSSAGSTKNSPTALTDKIVEASCGQCQLGLDGTGCDLAVRIDGKSYFVDGSSIDDHGDAHGDDGLCNCVRKAKVSGEIKEGRFVANSIEIIPKGTIENR